MMVALRKESVDRNSLAEKLSQCLFPSLSARRAWIEMRCYGRAQRTSKVALRKESVDRNNLHCVEEVSGDVALRKESVDRNVEYGFKVFPSVVALRKESVDRNNSFSLNINGPLIGRSPQGERG